MEGEGAQASMSVLSAAIERQRTAWQLKRVALAAIFSIDDPSGKLLKTPLSIKIGQALEVKEPLRSRRGAIFLDEERRTARICLPCHLTRRVAIATGAQAEPLIPARATVDLRAGGHAGHGG